MTESRGGRREFESRRRCIGRSNRVDRGGGARALGALTGHQHIRALKSEAESYLKSAAQAAKKWVQKTGIHVNRPEPGAPAGYYTFLLNS